MSVPVLSCPCGLRMKAKGATPGRVGRCPKCGRTLTVPGGPEVEVPAGEPEAEPVPRGYGLNPTLHPAVASMAPKRTAKPRAPKPALVEAPPSVEEPLRGADLGFPLRGAEGVMTVTMLGLAAWGSATLTPELALTFVADASQFGASLMGWLIAMIASMPGALLGFLASIYTLQYLGRVLVSGAMGEPRPPRPPDRNFDGLFEGLAPWVIWLFAGALVGLGPAVAYLASGGGHGVGGVAVALALGAVGWPYAAMALVMAFLRDDGFPRPHQVIGALGRFPGSFLAACGVGVVLVPVVIGAFAGALALRERAFWVYLPLMLPCWTLAIWAAVVAMRALGIFYHRHASTLRWHREAPWWAVTQGA